MRIPQNRPASASSYRGNPKRAASRKSLYVAWLANPTATNQQIANMCGVGITTACECKPAHLKIAHMKRQGKAPKTELQHAIIAILQSDPAATLSQIARACKCGKSTVWRLKKRFQADDCLRQGVQATNP